MNKKIKLQKQFMSKVKMSLFSVTEYVRGVLFPCEYYCIGSRYFI